MHHRDSTRRVHNQLRSPLTRAMAFLRTVLAIALLACVACDDVQARASVQQRVGAVADVELGVAEPTDSPQPNDCRDAYYCYGSCQGAGFLEGALASERHDACADACEPSGTSSRDHYGWWLDAVETQCAEDDSNECWWSAISFEQGQDLAATVLDGCMREGASW